MYGLLWLGPLCRCECRACFLCFRLSAFLCGWNFFCVGMFVACSVVTLFLCVLCVCRVPFKSAVAAFLCPTLLSRLSCCASVFVCLMLRVPSVVLSCRVALVVVSPVCCGVPLDGLGVCGVSLCCCNPGLRRGVLRCSFLSCLGCVAWSGCCCAVWVFVVC